MLTNIFSDKVSILVRFHDFAKLEQLSVCLLTLSGQEFHAVEPVILTQRFSSEAVAKIEELLTQFAWSSSVRPRVINVTQEAPQDLRCVLLNVGIRETKDSRFVAVLDYDDFVGKEHYSRLIERLKTTDAAIAFSGLMHVEQEPLKSFSYTMSKVAIPRRDVSIIDLYRSPQFGMGASVVDRSKIDPADLRYDESIAYEEDYNFHLRIGLKYPADFSVAAHNVPALMRTIQRDGSNTVITNFDAPEVVIKKAELRKAGRRANGALKRQFHTSAYDPFILFWLEPLPIRGGRAYDWVAFGMGSALAQVPERNFYGHLRLAFPDRYNPVISAFSQRGKFFRQDIELTRELESLFSFEIEGKYDWKAQEIAIWEQQMREQGRACEIQIQMLDKIFDIYPFQTVLTWGVSGAVQKYVRDNGIKQVSLELGPTRKPFLETAHCDPFGVNGEAMIARLPDDFSVPQLQSEDWLDEFIARIGRHVPPPLEIVEKAKASGGKVALIPLQMADDSNFVLHADKYGSFKDFLMDVVPQLVEAGWTCLIRPHPHAIRKTFIKADNDRCYEWFLAQNNDKIAWFPDQLSASEQYGLLHGVDAVVTVNSSVGFESMLVGKPTVVTGKSSYDLPSHAVSLEDLISHRKIEKSGILRAAAFNLFHQFVPVGDLFAPNTLMRRIEEAEAIRNSYEKGGADGLAKHLLANVRTTMVDYKTAGRNPVQTTSPDRILKAPLLERLPRMTG